jgi:hypothetical protein
MNKGLERIKEHDVVTRQRHVGRGGVTEMEGKAGDAALTSGSSVEKERRGSVAYLARGHPSHREGRSASVPESTRDAMGETQWRRLERVSLGGHFQLVFVPRHRSLQMFVFVGSCCCSRNSNLGVQRSTLPIRVPSK